jgi:hypothetical protein
MTFTKEELAIIAEVFDAKASDAEEDYHYVEEAEEDESTIAYYGGLEKKFRAIANKARQLS